MPTIARSVGVPGSQSSLEAAQRELANEPSLMLLDNFEHVIGAAGAVAELLVRCPELTIIVTSRDALRPVDSGLAIAWHLKKLFGDEFQIDRVVNLLANAEVLNALKTTDDPNTLPELWQKPLANFIETREKYLLYR